MNTTVISQLIGKTVSDITAVVTQGYIGNDTHTAGCKIKTTSVYSICTGTVLDVSRDPYDNTWCVTVENNSQRWVRYCQLSDIEVHAGQHLGQNDLIGSADKGVMRFEYCTTTKSQFPVRYFSRQMYKHDPTPILFGMIWLEEVY